MAEGILSQLPGLSDAITARGDVRTVLESLVGELPVDPAMLTETITEAIDAVEDLASGDVGALAAPLETAVKALQEAFPEGNFDVITTFIDRFKEIVELLEPVREVLLSENGLKDIKEVVYDLAGDPAAFIQNILAQFTRFIPSEDIQLLESFANVLRNFELSIPEDPQEIAGFLSQTLLGVPVDLLSNPLNVLDQFRDELIGLIDEDQFNDLQAAIASVVNAIGQMAVQIRAIDPTDTEAFQSAVSALEQLNGQVQGIALFFEGLTSTFKTGIDSIDVSVISNRLIDALKNIPEIRVAQFDVVIEHALEPLRRVNAQLEGLSADELRGVFGNVSSSYATLIEEEGIDEINTLIVEPFSLIGSKIDSLNLEQLRDPITDALTQVNDAISGVSVSFDDAKAGIQNFCDNLEDTLETISPANAGFTERIDEISQSVQTALSGIPLDAFKEMVDEIIENLRDVLVAFEQQLRAILENFSGFMERLEAIDLRDAAEPAFELIEVAANFLKKVNTNLLGEAEIQGVKLAARPLSSIDLAPISNQLIAELDEFDPSQPLSLVKEKAEELTSRIDNYKPSTLLEPLNQPFEQVTETLNQFDPAQLLSPVADRVSEIASLLDAIEPALLDALSELNPLLDNARQAVEFFKPSTLLAPIAELFDELMSYFTKLDITPLLDDLNTFISESLQESLSGLQSAGSALGEAGELKNIIDGLGGDEDDTFGYNMGDVLKPAADVFNKIMELIDQIPEDRLSNAFQAMNSQLRDMTSRITQSEFLADTTSLLQEGLSRIDFVRNYDVISSLDEAYSDLRVAFDEINPGAVPEEAREDYEALRRMVEDVNPAHALLPVRTALNDVKDQCDAFVDTFDVANLSPVAGAIADKVESLLPPFLLEDLPITELKAELQKLNPALLADEINQEYEKFLIKLLDFGDVIVEELPGVGGTVRDGLQSFLPDTLRDIFTAVYDPLKLQLDALNPAFVIEELDTQVYTPVIDALNLVDPVSLLETLNLDQKIEALKGIIQGLVDGIREIQTAVSATWNSVISGLDAFNPKHLQEQLDEAFGSIDIAFTEDFNDLLDRLGKLLDRLKEDLKKIIQDIEAALEDMIASIPS